MIECIRWEGEGEGNRKAEQYWCNWWYSCIVVEKCAK